MLAIILGLIVSIQIVILWKRFCNFYQRLIVFKWNFYIKLDIWLLEIDFVA